MFHTKFECPSMYTAWYIVPSMQEYSVHAHYLVCLIFIKYVGPFSIYGLQMFHAEFECCSIYAAWDFVPSMQEYSVHAH